MTQFPYYKGATLETSAVAPPAAFSIDAAPRQGLDEPSGYIPGADLEAAVNTALLLGMPLVLTGRPGCGKTQLGRAVSFTLGFPHFKYDTKSTSLARDIFYKFDVVGRFHASQIDKKNASASNPRRFIAYEALGIAILLSRPMKEVAHFLPQAVAAGDDVSILRDLKDDGLRKTIEKAWPDRGFRSVVVIDEVDKAPRDFPNDILNEIEQFYFTVGEFSSIGKTQTPAAPPDRRPFVIFTSNSEKQLPEAFLRRCVYHHIDDPDKVRLLQIIKKRLGAGRFGGGGPPSKEAAQFCIEGEESMTNDAVNFFLRLRQGEGDVMLRKPPGIAELLNWLQALVGMGSDLAKPLSAQTADTVRRSMGMLIKTKDDRDAVLPNLGQLLKGN